MRTGTLTINAVGDSLIGNLVDSASTRPPAHLAAKAAGSEAVFESRSTATLNMNGDQRTATAISTWTLKAKGDQLEGSLARRLEGMDGTGVGPNPITGMRQKASAR